MIDISSTTYSGGAGGIGEETSRVLALRGVHVIIAARSVESAETVKRKIIDELPDARIDVLRLDLSSLASVRSFVRNFKAMKLPLNILMYVLYFIT
jgi:NAD(P)-dependent dehydrogenase (short-subunit alcohol dehydrogenase family)